MKSHPLSSQTRPQIHLYTKGKQDTVLRDSFLLMKEAAAKLEKTASILYINTLTSAKTIEQVTDKLAERYDRELCTFSGSSRDVMQKLEFLEHTITAKNVKLLVLNSFEFAALFSRQKTLLAGWLREMRDAYGLRIAVYSMYPAQTNGGVGSLAWLADRTEQCGDWKYDEDISDTLLVQANCQCVAEEFMDKLDQDPEDARDASFFVDTPGTLEFKMMSEILGHRPLKNKDLAIAPTRSRLEHTSDFISDSSQPYESILEDFTQAEEENVEAELEMA